jgi:hypothetical protein
MYVQFPPFEKTFPKLAAYLSDRFAEVGHVTAGDAEWKFLRRRSAGIADEGAVSNGNAARKPEPDAILLLLARTAFWAGAAVLAFALLPARHHAERRRGLALVTALEILDGKIPYRISISSSLPAPGT